MLKLCSELFITLKVTSGPIHLLVIDSSLLSYDKSGSGREGCFITGLSDGTTFSAFEIIRFYTFPPLVLQIPRYRVWIVIQDRLQPQPSASFLLLDVRTWLNIRGVKNS